MIALHHGFSVTGVRFFWGRPCEWRRHRLWGGTHGPGLRAIATIVVPAISGMAVRSFTEAPGRFGHSRSQDVMMSAPITVCMVTGAYWPLTSSKGLHAVGASIPMKFSGTGG